MMKKLIMMMGAAVAMMGLGETYTVENDPQKEFEVTTSGEYTGTVDTWSNSKSIRAKCTHTYRIRVPDNKRAIATLEYISIDFLSDDFTTRGFELSLFGEVIRSGTTSMRRIYEKVLYSDANASIFGYSWGLLQDKDHPCSQTIYYRLTVRYEDIAPNLNVTDIVLGQSVPVTGDELDVSFSVANSGTMSVSSSFSTKVYLDGELLQEFTNNYVYHDSVIKLLVKLQPLAVGAHTLRVVADANNTIAESDENDNERSASFQVYGRTPYTVRFDANGGVGHMADQSFVCGTSQCLDSNMFTREKHWFEGWSLSPSGAVEFRDGQEVSNLTPVSGATVVLYAVWKAFPHFTIHFDPGGGEGIMPDLRNWIGETQNLPKHVFTHGDKTFLGWSTSTNGVVICEDCAKTSDVMIYKYDSAEGDWLLSNLEDGDEICLVAVWGQRVETKYSDLELYTSTNAVWSDLDYGESFACQGRTEFLCSGYIEAKDTLAGFRNSFLYSKIVGPGKLSFNWLVRSSNNTFSFLLNSPTGRSWNCPYKASEIKWQTISVQLDEGENRVCWDYTVGILGTSGSMAFIDSLRWVPDEHLSVSDENVNCDCEAGQYSVKVLAPTKLNWEVSSAPSWVNVHNGNGTSTSDLVFDVLPNTGSMRTGEIVIQTGSARATVQVVQDIWHKYSVVYASGNYASGDSVSATKIEGQTLMLSGGLFTRTGYTQEGWSKKPDGSSKDYALGAPYTAETDIMLYPYWAANAYSVAYDLAGGTAGAACPSDVTYDTAFKVPAPSRTGYTFAGWTVTSGLNTSTAKWGTTSSTAISLTSSSTICVNGATGNVYFKNLTATAGGSVTLTANWTAVPATTYTITYKPGTNGTGSQQTVPKTNNVALVLKGAIFTRTGYTQTGWATSEVGSKAYNLSASYTANAAATLYPFWTANTYSVSYALNGGTHGAMHPSSATYDTVFCVSAPSRGGYTFAGWTVTSGLDTSTAKWGTTSTPSTSLASSSTKCVNGATGNVYFKNLTATAGGSVTLTANWTAVPVTTYTITYAPGVNGIGSQQTAPKTNNVALVLKGAIFTRTGYTQTGWATSDGGAKAYDLSASYTANAAATLYPFWTANTYSVSYSLNGGTHGATHPSSATYDTAFYVSAPSRGGYTFAGWTVTSGLNTGTAKWGTTSAPSTSLTSSTTKCVNGATGNVYFKNLTATAGGSVTLTANWTAVPVTTYTITYKPGVNGTGSQQTATKTQNVALTLRGAAFTRTGYTQTGWATSDGGAKMYDLGASYTANAAATLYPFWMANTYMVTFDQQSGSGGTGSVTATYGAAMPSITVPTRSGYSFGGYYSETDGNGTQYYTASGASARTWDRTSATVLYANWMQTSESGENEPVFTISNGELTAVDLNGCMDVAIPDGVTSIWYGAFRACFSLRSISIPDSVTNIGNEAFQDCENLISVTIGKSVTSIGQAAFNGCTSLTSVVIPDSVTSMEYGAFVGCKSLESVTIGKGVTNIADMVFYNCPMLKSVTMKGDCPTVGENAFEEIASSCVVYLPRGNDTYTVTNGKWQGMTVEYNDAAVETYTVTLDMHGGSGGTASVTVTYGAAMPSITPPTRSGYTFGGYYTETSGSGTQYYTSSGTSARTWDKTSATVLYANWVQTSEPGDNEPVFTISNGVLMAVDLNGCKEVTIPDGVTSIGNKAFYGCNGITSVTIPSSVISIDDDAFSGCTGLTSVHITDLAKWCGISFSQDDSNPLYYARSLYVNGEKIIALRIPDGVTSIGHYAFEHCSSLTSVTIPNSVTNIGVAAFYYCGLKSASIPASVKSIGSWAFSWCSGLISVTINDSIARIGDNAFRFCRSLRSVTLGNSVTSIGDYAFAYCSSLETITIPDSVMSIGDNAFIDCSGLANVTIPGSVTSIGNWAFEKCSNLTSVTMPEKCPMVGEEVFESVNSMCVVHLPAGDRTYKVSGDRWQGMMVEYYYLLRTVAFDVNGGMLDTDTETVTLPDGEMLGALPIPKRDGFTFLGWFTAETGGKQVTAATKVTGDVTYYAHWQYRGTADENTIVFETEDEYTTSSDGAYLLNLSEVVGSVSVPKVSVKGLPAGLKYDAATMTIGGRATKPGVYTVTVSATNATVEKPVTTTFEIVVPNLTSEVMPNLAPERDAYGTIHCGVAFDPGLVDCSPEDGWTVKAAGLPAGLKYDAKTGEITGVPTKAGTYTVTFTATKKGEASQVATITLDIAPLPAWAAGTFTGYIESVVDGAYGHATMTVAANGKISGKITLDGTNWTFSASSYAFVESPSSDVDDATFILDAVAKAGKATMPVSLAVRSAGARDACPYQGGTPETAGLVNASVSGTFMVDEVRMWRSMWKDKATAADAKAVLAEFAGAYTLSFAPGEDSGSGYLSLTVGKNGDVKATGKLADGTSVSATSPLVYDEEAGWFVLLYAAPSAYKGGAFAAGVGFTAGARDARPYRLEPVMFTPQWASRNPQATGEYGAGFLRTLDFTGAYYNKLDTLGKYYDSMRIELGGAPALGYSFKRTYIGDDGRKASDTAERVAAAVDTSSQEGMVVSVDETGKFVAAKATKPVQNKETKEWYYDGANDGALTVSFAQATGIFKGSYTFWYDYVSASDETTGKDTYKHISKKVNFEGIIVQGEESMRGFYLWDATGAYEDPKTGKEKTYKYKESHLVSSSHDSATAATYTVSSSGELTAVDLNGCTEVAIPGGVTSIGDMAFFTQKSITSVTMPNSVTNIGNEAFQDCENLMSVTMGNGVMSIGQAAFNGCMSLTSVTIPDSVTDIGYGAFVGCSSLASVTVGSGVTSIGDMAFYNCPMLKSVTMRGDCPAVGESAFEEIDSTCVVHLPRGNSTYTVTDGEWQGMTVEYYDSAALNRDKVQLWVDGPYWATTNIGAEQPEDSGYYFWWGDTVGYKREGDVWVASDGSSSNFSFEEANTPTYGKNIATLQGEGWITADGVLAPEHDAAHVQWGGNWRMPTDQELTDLNDKCDWTSATQNGVSGYVVRGRGAYASNSIFLPATDYGEGTSLSSSGPEEGGCWSSIPYSYNSGDRSWYFYFSTFGNITYYYYDRYIGFPVRPVKGFAE